MNPSNDPLQERAQEIDQAQLWLRQRRLNVASRPKLPDDPECGCQADDGTLPALGESIDSSQILRGRREVRIGHAGETYRLLVTRNNKLILQK